MASAGTFSNAILAQRKNIAGGRATQDKHYYDLTENRPFLMDTIKNAVASACCLPSAAVFIGPCESRLDT